MNKGTIMDLSLDFPAGTWHRLLASEFDKSYFKQLEQFLSEETKLGKKIFPARQEVFKAFEICPFEQVKVVILGQDPYHGEGQAHGLSFSVPRGVRCPPSLKNIYKEINRDLGVPIPEHGNLKAWAEQGVLLLNTVLTVEEGKAGSHQKKGWETFTDKVIEVLKQKPHLVFMLWGNHAQKKATQLPSNFLILKSVHPSPLSAHRGFIGNGHFSQANHYLKRYNLAEIIWNTDQLE